jgi:LmbE family N-acetylglucosaminyl deacetylase
VRVHLVTATRGDRGRYRGKPPGDPAHPGQAALAGIREVELRDAARALGIHDVSILGYPDGSVDRVDAREAVAAVAQHIRRIRPQVVVTFGPDGAYGHPDHVAVSQFATAAVVAAAHPASQIGGAALGADAHVVSKFYYLAWPAETWDAYHAAIGVLRATVDGVERQAVPWPDWMITTVVDTRNWWSTTWQAVSCHQSQVSAYERLRDVSAAHHEALWGRQSYYRVFSTVNGGRGREADLFDGLSC